MLDSFRIESASISDRGLSPKRPQNEDSFLEIPQSGIFAVADGVGGAEAGEVASQMAVEILGEAFINETDLGDAEEVMRAALEEANSAIHRTSNELPQLSSMATTIVALHIAGNIATIGHAGDSRLYRLDAEGNLFRETDDHSMVAEEVRAGRMTELQAENHPGKNIISRALGAEPTVEVELKTIMVGPNTTFLICSDGVTRHIGDREIADLLRSGADPKAICDQIKDLCFQRGAEDNLTAVVVRLTAEGQDRPAAAAIAEKTDDGETTIATARGPVAQRASDPEPADLLELETAELTMPSEGHGIPEAHLSPDSTSAKTDLMTEPVRSPVQESPFSANESQVSTSPHERELEFDTLATIPVEERVEQPRDADGQQSIMPPNGEVELSGNLRNNIVETEKRPGTLGKIASSVGLLLIGSLIGLAGYHYLLANRTPEPIAQPITEMRSSNQQLSAFEDNRRTLDKDPEAALKRFITEPKDAENMFLIGRAYLLTGKYPEARNAFNDSLELIAAGNVDPNNAKTIQKDISIAMTIVNDPLAQKNFKKELEDPKAVASPAANGSRAPTR